MPFVTEEVEMIAATSIEEELQIRDLKIQENKQNDFTSEEEEEEEEDEDTQ